MEMIDKYEGAVFFVDLLGIGALTRNELKLSKQDFNYWLENAYPKSNQYLAAAVLATFREVLLSINRQFEGQIVISQLSDCAFIWSNDIVKVTKVACIFMQRAINAGLLCRGGLASGEIIETKQSHTLGRFIVGAAVTEAVMLEKIAKGARVLIKSEFVHALFQADAAFNNRMYMIFQPFTNPLDYEIYDELQWYLVPEKEILANVDVSQVGHEKKLDYTKARLKIGALVRTSPMFNWNARSPQGLVHLKATIAFITQNKLLDIYHNFEWSNVITIPDKRSNEITNALQQKINENEHYRKIKPSEDPFAEI